MRSLAPWTSRLALARRALGLSAAMVVGLAAASIAPAGGLAQEPPASTQPVLTDPVSGERYIEVRPTEALERGRWAVPPWLVWGLGALATMTGVVVLARRSARARRGR